jgi:hypothetical protein
MNTIHTISRVGPDGVVNVSVPVGVAEAGKEVQITLEPLPEARPEIDDSPERWEQFLKETAGAWQGERLERPDQGDFEKRDEWP